MSVPPRTDFWQVGIVPAPIATLVNPAALAAMRDRIVWLPDAGPWRYLADPFAVQRGDATHVFVEAF
ncbi:MAG: glycosyl hydrolase family 43, partial [Lacunisphaera sp.]